MLKTVLVRDLKPNPFRRLDEYPILREKVDALKESIESTGFWGTIVGRQREPNTIEIAFGHHRLKALQESLGDNGKVEIIIRDLSNEDMLKMMARENMEEWGTSAWVELETIRSVIEAYGKGEIELPELGKRGPRQETSPGSAKFFSRTTVAVFLGWTKKNKDGLQPNLACETAFKAIEMIDNGFLDESDLKGISRKQMHVLVSNQWSIYQAEIREAKSQQEEAERARERAKHAPTPTERQRFEKRATVHQEQAQQHQEDAKKKSRSFGKEAAAMFREGSGLRDVKRRAEEIRTPIEQSARVIDIDKFVDQIIKKLDRIADRDDPISQNIKFLRENIRDLSDGSRRSLCDSFETLIKRLRKLQESVDVSSSPRSHQDGTGGGLGQRSIAVIGSENGKT